jgi:hypothetical protein
MNFITCHQITELTIITLQGLRKCSCTFLAHKVNDLMMANDVNKGGKIGNKKMDVIKVLMQVEDYYKVLLDQDGYSPDNVPQNC